MSRFEGSIAPLAAVKGTPPSTTSLGAFLLSVVVLTTTAAAQTVCPRPPGIRVRTGTSFAAADSASLGHWYLEQKSFSCAARAFSVASHELPNNSSFLYFLGLSLERDGKMEASLKPLQEAARLDPTNPAPHVASGEVFDLLNRRTEAETEWRSVLAIDPSSGAALDHLSNDLIQDKDFLGVVSLLGQGRNSNSLSQAQTLNLGEALGLLARLDEAITVLKDGLQRYPGSAALADEMATVQLLAGQQELAYSTLQRAITEHPEDRPTEALYLNALINGKSEKAAPWAEKLIAEHPKDAGILYLGAELAWSTGDSTRAEELIKRSLASDASDYKAQHLYGTVLVQRGDLHEAEEHLEKSIALGDPEPDVRYQLSRVQKRLGDTAGSKKSLQTFMSRNASEKSRIEAAEDVAQGDQAMQRGDPAASASLFRQALQMLPDAALIHYKLSRALDQMHESAEEWGELQRAVQLDPNFAAALNQMGYLSLHGGDPQKAEGFFDAATKASPSYVIAWTNLAATFASEAKWQQAEDATDHALRLDPGNNIAKRLKASIVNSRSTP